MARRTALVIGNATFPESDTLDNLHTPVTDAREIANMLAELGDFEVAELLLDEPAEVLRRRVERFFNGIGRGDLALVYYSGHGFKDKGGRLYFAARDTDTRSPLSSALDAGHLRRAAELSECRHIITVLDCCYAGSYSTGTKGPEQLELDKALCGETLAVLASSRGSQVSFEGNGKTSVFTRIVLDGIRTSKADMNHDGAISLQELFEYVTLEMPSEQTPTLQFSTLGDSVRVARGIAQNLSTIYILSTADDEGTYLSAWLSAKLRLQGYAVENMKPNELLNVEQLIRHSAVLIPILTTSALNDTGFLSQLAVAKEIQTFKNYLVPVDAGGGYDEVVGQAADRMCDFRGNLATGLNEVLAYLHTSNLLVESVEVVDVLNGWSEDLSLRNAFQSNKPEIYKTNWFEISLPENIYVYAFDPNSPYVLEALGYPAVQLKDYLISFAPRDALEDDVRILETYIVKTEKLSASSYELDKGVILSHPNHKLIELLNLSLEKHMESKGLKRYEQSSRSIFYFDEDEGERPHKRRSLSAVGHSNIQLTGNMKARTWHYALSAQAFLYPVVAFYVLSHFVFKEGGKLLDSKKLQHRARRKKSKSLHNTQIRNMMLGGMLELMDEGNLILLPTGQEPIKINNFPYEFVTDVGYIEPSLQDQADGLAELGEILEEAEVV